MVKEFESKCLITKSEYDKILDNNNINIISEVTNNNTYYDTDDSFYKNNNSALRIRQSNDSCVLTLKVSKNDCNEEYNHIIYKPDIISISIGKLTKYKFPFTHNENKDLHSISFITNRKKIKYNDIIFELDKTNFNGTIDYEIEIESDDLDTSNLLLSTLLSSLDITYKKSTPKIKRYFIYNK